jgi:apolipoprotein N-acyltransferase
VIGGVLFSLAFPPVAAWPLAFVAPTLLFLALRESTPARGFALGLAFGLVGFGLTLSWLQLFGTLAWGALTVLTALSIALFGGLFPLVRRAGHPFLTALGAAALWTSID